jgi:hypothetical protein
MTLAQLCLLMIYESDFYIFKTAACEYNSKQCLLMPADTK